jgi:hypothetical protein
LSIFDKNIFMKTVATILLITFQFLSFGQIDANLTKSGWKVGSEKIIYGNTILRLEGKNDIGGVLNVGYETPEQLISQVVQKADKEMWTEEKKASTIKSYQDFAAGGVIALYITRLTIDAANTDMFTVIVRDSTDKNEIYRTELESSIPQVPSSGSSYWWNYSSIPLPTAISGKVYIYVIDKLGGDNGKFKFELTL